MKENEVTQSCLTLGNAMDCRLAGSNVRGILQERILECIAISFSKECRPTAAYSLMDCVLTLTLQLCIRCIHMGTLSCSRVSARIVSLWKVPGRKSEPESQDLPTPHSPAQLRSPSRLLQHHSRIPVPPPRHPEVPRAQVRHGSLEPCENSPAGFQVLWPRLSPGSERFATESMGCLSPRQDPWPLQLPKP